MKPSFSVALTATATAILGVTMSATEPQVWRSGPLQVALVELFTSEGCSSCPPAEKWLAGLVEAPELWRDFVPVAFHVDYWDGLGWPDRFATKANTQRQERYAAHWRSRGLYTPGFVLNGGEWRGWGDSAALAKFPKLEVGQLEVVVSSADQFKVTFSPLAGRDNELVATVAWLGIDLASDVRRGENAGRQLRHSFVVLRLATGQLEFRDGVAQRTVMLAPPKARDAGKLALAAWVSRRDEPVPLQSVGGWWTNSPARTAEAR